MIARRSVVRLKRPRVMSARPVRGALIATFAIAAGVVTGLAAASGIGPFAGLKVQVSHLVQAAGPTTPLVASALYPLPERAVIHNIIDVYDLAPPGASKRTISVATAFVPTIVFPAGPMSAIEAACESAKNAAQGKPATYIQAIERQCEAAKQAYEHAHP